MLCALLSTIALSFVCIRRVRTGSDVGGTLSSRLTKDSRFLLTLYMHLQYRYLYELRVFHLAEVQGITYRTAHDVKKLEA